MALWCLSQVADFLHRALELSVAITKDSGKMLKDFVDALSGNDDIKVRLPCAVPVEGARRAHGGWSCLGD